MSETAPQVLAQTSKASERRFLIWVSTLVLLMVTIAIFLQLYANQRRETLHQLERLISLANYQSSLEWRAIYESSGEAGDIPSMRFENDFASREVYSLLDNLLQTEQQQRFINQMFGFADSQRVQETLETSVTYYQSSVLGLFGQLSGGLRNMAVNSRSYFNPDYDYLRNTLFEISQRNQTLAKRATLVSNLSTLLAVLSLILAASWISHRLSKVRARRVLELQEERLKTLGESEARFKALVQHADGLIAILESDSRVRYASPAIETILGQESESSFGKFFWSEVLNVNEADAEKLEHDDKGLPLELRIQRQDGQEKELEVRVQNHLEHPYLQGIVINAHDITERKTLEHQLRYQALHDPLTDLPNRRFFAQRLETALAETLGKVVVLFIDLEGIKWVNDSFGHDRGDLLLIEASRRIRHCLRSEDTLGRLGGDELVAVLPSVFDEAGALEVSKRIFKALTLPFTIENQEVFLTPSIGISLNGKEATPNDLVRHAGIAMYQAKREAKGILFFEQQMGEEAPERLRLESDMRRGIEQDEFTVYYQPKVDLHSGKVVSLEALVRWQHPKRGFVSPGKFIPFAEETGLIEPLGKIVLETACREAVKWQQENQDLVIAVNLSAIQFRNPNLVQDIADVLKRTGLPPQALELEITESAVLGDVNATIATLEELKGLGIRLAIDDFGTGYSNLGHLRRFPVDVLKIDQSFVKGMSGQHDDTPIVEAVVSLAKALNLHVVAEGVETAQQMEQLREMGCHLGQGYYFARPLSSAAIEDLLSKTVT
jgi:diguanylate cyclase (GGDEF)-like protein/PAS domain S-box-containing protein